jgi:malonyl-CoA reductase/3-hydroxypropionate dehydrogenase (NADP+)
MTQVNMPAGRLAGKIAFVTGTTGNIGGEIARRFLLEGADVIMTGRDPARLAAAREKLLQSTQSADVKLFPVVMDGADPAQVRAAVNAAMAHFGRIDVVVNNAGSAGPRQKLEDVPLTRAELEALRAGGAGDSETAGDAARNLLGVPWNVARAVAPVLAPGASLINVSTIFSRTPYFGRTAYVVPKAAVNALSRRLAAEFGAHGVRVNTILPGPIESERIRKMFSSMDHLRVQAEGTTAGEFFGMMTLARSIDGAAPERTFPRVADVVNAAVYLASEEAAALNGHDVEVTHGMTVYRESRSTSVARPDLRTVDGTGIGVIVFAGDLLRDALEIARLQSGCGATVFLGVGSDEQLRAAAASLGDNPADTRIRPVLADRARPETVAAALAQHGGDGRLHTAIVMPALGPGQLRGPLRDALDADVDAFIDRELVGAIALGRELTRYWKSCGSLDRVPRTVFMSNGDDGAGNVYGDLLRAGVEQLIRVWRDESTLGARAGQRKHPEWSNQIIRYTNTESEELTFSGGESARMLFSERQIQPINLYLPESIVGATSARRAALGWMENLLGLHKGKVALITGGSSGIGGQIGRLLAASGARVMLVSRGVEQLQEMRDRIVDELEDSGYSGARRRVQILAGVDVADLTSVEHAASVTLATFGRLDYLINCAGVAGAEEMVVDMPLDAWRRTLDANLISNYALIQRLVPVMKRQGSGYIVNVSSYFGGEKYVSTPYPNRADYATSKAGQRALAENLARFLGPEIQINAISPGPVEGERLKGSGGRAGLFERRGRLILENRRLNAVHGCLVKAVRNGASISQLLDRLACNDIPALLEDKRLAEDVRSAMAEFAKEGKDGASCGRFVMTASIANKLLWRLKRGGYFLQEADRGARFGQHWPATLPVPPEPYLPAGDIAKEASKIRSGVLSLLHLQRMPTEFEVALATVFYLADRAVSGETFQPSGGLNLERSSTERELFGSAKRARLDLLEGRTVWLIGEHLDAHLARAAAAFVEQGRVGRVMLITQSAEGAAAVMARLAPHVSKVTRSIVSGNDVEDAMDQALIEGGRPTAVVSTPFSPLPDVLFDPQAARQPLDTEGFRALIEANLTHHFRVARKAVLFDDVQLMLVAPDVAVGKGPEAFALANFVKTTLHAMTGTLAVECERLVHEAVVNQINLTRRVRSEEPRNDAETAEELERFGRAVLLAGAPLPNLEDSRYRSRIYRGMALTV